MKTKFLTLATAAAIALGTAGLATTASAWGGDAGTGILAKTSTDNQVQTVGSRVRVRIHVRRHRIHRRHRWGGYYYPGYYRPGHYGYAYRCRRLRRLAYAGYRWARRAYYRRGCARLFGPIRRFGPY